tara:strand:+ start:720 stop:968 length:249 start_codon:yes stop_codon:yes gene_type:complete
MLNTEELEWYSNCCSAPPIGELHYDEVGRQEEQTVHLAMIRRTSMQLAADAEDPNYYMHPVGMCMKCREGAIFYLEGATDET